MGLDIYLYRFEDYAKAMAIESEYETESSKIWERYPAKYDDMTDDQRSECRGACDALKERMGLGQYGEVKPPLRSKIEEPSKLHPDNICSLGYFRSSYNDSGFDRVTKTVVGLDGFYWIFGVDGQPEEYEVLPDWQASRGRAAEMVERLKGKIGSSDNVFCFHVGPNIFDHPDELHRRVPDRDAALKIYREQVEQFGAREKDSPFGSNGYSNRDGSFYLGEPLEIVAAVPGFHFNTIGVFLIGKRSDDVLSSYIESAEIAVETCDYVLATGEPEKHRLAWSG